MLSTLIYAQNDVTKFLGIPVDGYKHEMIQKLKEKGFVSNLYSPDILEGEFNGKPVYIAISTNNNKVHRIMVKEKVEYNENNIKARYNQLCHQFECNSKYIRLSNEEYTIPSDENISYEMLVNKKQYQAVYLQHTPNKTDSLYMELIQTPNLSAETIDAMSALQTRVNRLEVLHKLVWFTISKENAIYKLLLFYENEYNKANGEDL